MFSSEQLYWII